MQNTQAQSLDWENPLEKDLQLTPVFFPGKSHGQGSLIGLSPKGLKELDTTEWLSTHAHMQKNTCLELMFEYMLTD